MTPDEFRAARRKLGSPTRSLSHRDTARALGISDGRSSRRYQSGDSQISQVVGTLLRYFMRYGIREDLTEPPASPFTRLVRYFQRYGIHEELLETDSQDTAHNPECRNQSNKA